MAAQTRRVGGIDLADGVVELSDAGKPCRESDVTDRKGGSREQDSGRVGAARPGQRERGRPHLGSQHASEMTRCVAQPVGQTWYSLSVHDAVTDQAHRRAHRVGSQVPFGRPWGRVRQTTTAGSKAGRLGRGRSGIEGDISAQRRPGRTGRPAVDTGGADGGEELPVETGISGLHGPVGRFGISYHNNDSAISPDLVLADFGHGSHRPSRRSSGAHSVPQNVRTSFLGGDHFSAGINFVAWINFVAGMKLSIPVPPVPGRTYDAAAPAWSDVDCRYRGLEAAMGRLGETSGWKGIARVASSAA